ncbi:DUF2218 domain-containing protein [Kiloniella litopenaei]|uniref:DUF2218 domain-containing protein n=1 Tax=Kiloniella litopenaei TaxID=1549748 RepID=UPI003BAB8F0B
MTMKASVQTDHASKYLQQLCKHFAHKVSVQYTPEKGDVDFGFGDCLMMADEKGLSFVCHADDRPRLEKIESIISIHLEKFAWRENLEMKWEYS